MNTQNLTNDMEFNRFGWIAIILLVVGCLGGLTVGMGAIENTIALVAVVIPTMITLSLLLAVSPMKWVMTSTAIAISVDVILLTYYIIS
ncbi:MAG: hypothetical protein FGM14_13260 [Flavobacteriales bacterium]|nr:hypothetical protein [Flavobacteriales bacterium]